MKFFVSLIVISIVTAAVYVLSKKRGVAAILGVFLLGCLAFAIYRDATAPDMQCTATHTASTRPPASLKTYKDYLAQGDYEYETGNCSQAIFDYTTALDMYPIFRQAYNNRAYTYMRMRDYRSALQDLDTALFLNPYYIQALMNRGDIYNYYYSIDRQRAIADYQKVIMLGGTQGTSVCGHLFLARNNGWNIVTILGLPLAALRCM